ncbi:hypothetical protein NPIL_273901 [Nephila pilipes]|uniref:Uncharacterized protein n=1 Tax=Nephila pilipes TaxID=299642 RepID=A0A8X6QBX6_NEPPI|nr:hypothetical protein NPIL_273901 [Nephila pilipes]
MYEKHLINFQISPHEFLSQFVTKGETGSPTTLQTAIEPVETYQQFQTVFYKQQLNQLKHINNSKQFSISKESKSNITGRKDPDISFQGGKRHSDDRLIFH